MNYNEYILSGKEKLKLLVINGQIMKMMRRVDKLALNENKMPKDLATAYQKWDLNASEIKGYSLLPPFAKQEKFSIQVGPNNFGIILAIKNQSFGSYSKWSSQQTHEGNYPHQTG